MIIDMLFRFLSKFIILPTIMLSGSAFYLWLLDLVWTKVFQQKSLGIEFTHVILLSILISLLFIFRDGIKTQ